jgi:hypothetical protein
MLAASPFFFFCPLGLAWIAVEVSRSELILPSFPWAPVFSAGPRLSMKFSGSSMHKTPDIKNRVTKKPTNQTVILEKLMPRIFYVRFS